METPTPLEQSDAPVATRHPSAIGLPLIRILVACSVTLFISSTAYVFLLRPEPVTQRISQVTRELHSLGSHDWAGRYYAGDGLGVSLSLYIAPKSGAAFQWHGCMGLYDQNCTSLKVLKDRIQVRWTLPSKENLYKPDEYLIVRWGKRRYLVPPDDIRRFSLAVSTGTEPRTDQYGMFLLRDGDEKVPVNDKPQLPPGFEGF
jgi:hypothetical protein